MVGNIVNNKFKQLRLTFPRSMMYPVERKMATIERDAIT